MTDRSGSAPWIDPAATINTRRPKNFFSTRRKCGAAAEWSSNYGLVARKIGLIRLDGTLGLLAQGRFAVLVRLNILFHGLGVRNLLRNGGLLLDAELGVEPLARFVRLLSQALRE